MKVLHLYGHTYGGNFVITQLREFVQLGFDVTVICTGQGEFARLATSVGAKVIFSDFQGSRLKDIPKIFRSIFSIRKYIKKEKPDAVHYHLIKAIIVGRLACMFLKGVKTVSQLGGPLTLEVAYFRWLDLLTSFVDDDIICSSNRIQEIYGKYCITRNKCSIVHYAFPLGPFLEVDKVANRRSVCNEFGLPSDSRVIGMVAYMYKSNLPQFRKVGIKGHEVLLSAAVDIIKCYPSVKFLIVGQDIDGGVEYFNELVDMTVSLGIRDSFIFTGFRKDIPRLISAMDIVVVPSLSENCGGAVEPLLMGVPVVASDVGGLPDVVIEGKTGWLSTPGDPGSLAAALKNALGSTNNQLAALGENGTELVVRLFDPYTNAKKIEKIYRRNGSVIS